MIVPKITDGQLTFFPSRVCPPSAAHPQSTDSKDWCLLSTEPWDGNDPEKHDVLTKLNTYANPHEIMVGNTVYKTSCDLSIPTGSKLRDGHEAPSLQEYGRCLYDYFEEYREINAGYKHFADEKHDAFKDDFRELVQGMSDFSIITMKEHNQEEVEKAMEEATAHCIAESFGKELWTGTQRCLDPKDFVKEAIRCRSLEESAGSFATGHANTDLEDWTREFGRELGLTEAGSYELMSKAMEAVFGVKAGEGDDEMELVASE